MSVYLLSVYEGCTCWVSCVWWLVSYMKLVHHVHEIQPYVSIWMFVFFYWRLKCLHEMLSHMLIWLFTEGFTVSCINKIYRLYMYSPVSCLYECKCLYWSLYASCSSVQVTTVSMRSPAPCWLTWSYRLPSLCPVRTLCMAQGWVCTTCGLETSLGPALTLPTHNQSMSPLHIWF